mgnify:FL=1|jgi:hypothetical protein|tara:strand:- start:654 stop:1067 length:414 start_codon:yes stop_codon:yes gene_type:complete
MPNRLDAHISQQSDPNLNKRKMYLHLTSAFLFGILPAGVIYAMDDKLGLYVEGWRLVPCGYNVDMNTWLLTSAYASASYVGVTCFLLLCVTCTPGGEASTMQKMTCMNLINQTFLLGLVLWFAKGAYVFNTKVGRDR